MAERLKPIIVTSVTLGKELHAGHMLLLASADVLRVGFGSDKPTFLVNNNTGPRAAGTVVALSGEYGWDIEKTADNLSRGLIPVEQVIDAYRSRAEGGETFEDAFNLLDSGHYDIFQAMAESVALRLGMSGLKVNIVPESELLRSNCEIIERVNPDWAGTGFVFSRDTGICVLQKGGRLTATGKGLITLVGLSRMAVAANETAMMIFVDAARDSMDTVNTFSSLSEFGRAMLLPGAGISFDGKIASGTGGEALTISELSDAFQEKCPNGILSVALRYLVLNRPVVRMHGELLSLYDYKDNDSFLNDLVRCFEESIMFEKEVVQLVKELKEKVGDVSYSSDRKTMEWLKFLPQRTRALIELSPENVFNFMNNFSRLGASAEFNRLLDGLITFKIEKTTAVRLMVTVLGQGVNTASSVVECIRSQKINLPSTFLRSDYEVRCAILDCVKEQGYQGEDAVKRTIGYMDGLKGLFIRGNYHRGILNQIFRLQGQVVSLHADDFNMIDQTIQICMERLGYETK